MPPLPAKLIALACALLMAAPKGNCCASLDRAKTTETLGDSHVSAAASPNSAYCADHELSGGTKSGGPKSGGPKSGGPVRSCCQQRAKPAANQTSAPREHAPGPCCPAGNQSPTCCCQPEISAIQNQAVSHHCELALLPTSTVVETYRFVSLNLLESHDLSRATGTPSLQQLLCVWRC